MIEQIIKKIEQEWVFYCSTAVVEDKVPTYLAGEYALKEDIKDWMVLEDVCFYQEEDEDLAKLLAVPNLLEALYNTCLSFSDSDTLNSIEYAVSKIIH